MCGLSPQSMTCWSDASPAPVAVMELIACKCPRQCLEESCSCIHNKLKCTYLCKLQTCSNMQEDEDEVGESDQVEYEGSSSDTEDSSSDSDED